MEIPDQLLRPASDMQLRDFSDRLGNVARNLSKAVDKVYAVSFGTKLYYDDDQVGRVNFGYNGEFGIDSYTLSLSKATPIDDTWDSDIVNNLLGGSTAALDEVRDHVTTHDREYIGSATLIKGFLEQDTVFKLERCGRYVTATKAATVNVVDTDYLVANAHIGFARGKFIRNDEGEAADLERLYTNDSAVLDVDTEEHLLARPTSADLIICTKALLGINLLRKGTVAYRGAGPYMENAIVRRIF